jgi:NADPH:quinone reductase-like Zn-dependent oxidoreductase
MSKNLSIVVTKPGEVAVQEVPAPKLRDDYVLIKVKAIALNPTDWKHVDWLTSEGARVSQTISAGHVQTRLIKSHADRM